MELRHLRYFVVLAEELHFSRAAMRLHLAQPPLSRQIRDFEEELGVELFHRTKRRVQLTDAGRVLLAEARSILGQVEHAVRSTQRAGRGELGRLAVGFNTAAVYDILPTILREFHVRFPDVELMLREMPTSEQTEALRDGRIQVGIVRLPIDDATVVTRSIARQSLVLALPEGHRLAHEAAVPIRALSGEPFVLFPPWIGSKVYEQTVRLCREAGFEPRVGQEALQIPTLVSLVGAGIGVALVPASVRSFHGSRVVYKPLADQPTPEAELAIAHRRDDASPVVTAFVRVAIEVAQNSDCRS